MFKKVLLMLFSASLLIGCGTTLEQKYPDAKYKIADQDMKQIIATMNTLEQCFNPELKNMSVADAYKNVYDKYSKLDDIIWNEIVFPKVIVDTVGEKNLEIITQDKASENYFAEKQTKLNNQTDTVDWVDCQMFKNSFNKIKAKVEKELGKQEPNKIEEKIERIR